jgi:hypothetical protein
VLTRAAQATDDGSALPAPEALNLSRPVRYSGDRISLALSVSLREITAHAARHRGPRVAETLRPAR